ncbi:MAG: hypothetical protein M1834_004293 [Cirrosporium novae-zelandiae]|nr:MAG: hypothetical protein M1834_004293 [Cirrosporium novae-zelandiae]
MSDIEDYYSDEDDFFFDDGIFMDESDLEVDNLASHTIPSPVHAPDAYDVLPLSTLETIEYSSDWDYLSDDYLEKDEDHTSSNSMTKKRKREAEGHGDKEKGTEKESGKEREKKRKYTKSKDKTSFKSQNERMPLGVSWKKHLTSSDFTQEQQRKGRIYKPGESKKVALLKDWRKLGKVSLSPLISPRAQILETENMGMEISVDAENSQGSTEQEQTSDAEILSPPTSSASPSTVAGQQDITKKILESAEK